MGFKSYDIELGGIPLMLAVDKIGKQSIDFGLAPREPGPVSEVGSIVMPSFHHGPGQILANDTRAIRSSLGVDISSPGRVFPGGAYSLVLVGGADDFYWNQGGGSIVVPKQGNPANAPKIYFVTAKRIYSVDTATDTTVVVYTNSSEYAFTGQIARFRDKLFFPRETEDLEAASPIILNLPTEDAYEGVGIKMSRVFGAQNSAWWVVNHGYLTPPEIYWSDDDNFPGDPICVSVKWTGNGSSQNITSLPWKPDIIIAKSDYTEPAVLKTDTMNADESRTWDSNTMLTTAITGFLSNGFSIGSHDAVNKSGYEYVAVCFKKKDGLIDTLAWDGDGIDNRDIPCSFSPDLSIVAKGAGGSGNGEIVARPKTLAGVVSFLFTAAAPITNAIQTLGDSSFQVGTDARVNQLADPAVKYHACIFKETIGVLGLETYVGDGTYGKEIDASMLGEFAIIKCADTYKACQRMTAKDGDWSAAFWGQTFATEQISEFTATGFKVGTNPAVNQGGKTYHYMLFGPTTAYVKAGPFTLDAGGYCSWLHVIGPWTLPFKADGMVYGVNEYGEFCPLFVHSEGAGTDIRYAHGARMDWRGRLLIPTAHSLKALNFPSLEGEDVNPIQQLVGSESDYAYIEATCAVGSRQLIALRGNAGMAVFLLQQYPDGEFLTPIFAQSLGYRCYAAEAVRLAGGSYATYLLAERSGGQVYIFKVHIAAIDHSIAPQSVVTTGAFQTSLYAGEGLAAGVTKGFLQLRGYAPAASVAHPITFQFGVDGGVAQALGTVTSAGPFSIPMPATTAALGRYVTIYGNPLGDGNLALPLIVDFEHLPAVDDIVTFGCDVRDITVNALGGVWRQRPAREVHQTLLDMRGQVVPLKFSDGRADWTVRIENVTLQNTTRRAFAQGEQDLVFVAVRRLT